MSLLVKSFRALQYSPKKFKNLSGLVCPPYDIIGEKEKKFFNRKSKYNFSYLLLVERNNDYKILAKRFNNWLDKNILVRDDTPSIYLYEQKFNFENKTFRRIGFLGLLKLDKKGIIFPHETTFKGPKIDRWRILKEMKANLSPIFVISDKKLKTLKNIYKSYVNKVSSREFEDFDGIANRLWKIEDKDLIKSLSREISKNKLFIADGHHRFEVAHKYFKLNQNRFEKLNYLLAYFTDPSEGLLILPTHRVVTLKDNVTDMFKKLSLYFLIREISEDDLKIDESKGKSFSFIVYAKRKFYFLKLRNEEILDKIFKTEKDRIYKQLNVCVLHRFVLKNLDIDSIDYVHSIAEVKKMATGKKIGFILKAAPLAMVFSIAKGGLLLPQKSTYFYPKVLSGLVLRKFEK